MSKIRRPEVVDISKTGLYYLIKYSAFFFIIILITVLKPHRFYKKLLKKIFLLTITIKGNAWKLYHLLMVGLLFYGTIFVFLICEIRNIHPKKIRDIKQRMDALDKKWVKETMLWLDFIVLVCLATIYRNAALFSKEDDINSKLNELKKEVDEAKKGSGTKQK